MTARESRPVRHAHLSLFHGANARGVAAYVAEVAELVDVITTTETTRRMTLLIRRKLGRRWVVRRRGEYVVAVRRTRFTMGRGSLARLGWVHKVAAWRDLWVHRRLIVDKGTGAHYRLIVGHWAAGVEAGTRYRTNAAKDVRTHQAGLAATGKLVAREKAAHPTWRFVPVGDFNVNFHHPEWIRLVARETGTTPVWAKHEPDGGTHAGGRLIDAACTDDDIEVLGARLCPVEQPGDVDHGGLITRYRATS